MSHPDAGLRGNIGALQEPYSRYRYLISVMLHAVRNEDGGLQKKLAERGLSADELEDLSGI